MVLCWSGNYIAAKIVFREVPAGLAFCLRTLVAGALMVPIFWARERKKPSVWSLREIGILTLLGIGGISVNQFFWTLGVARTTVVHSSMIMATTPLWVLLIAGAMRIESITVLKVAGMVIALTGVALLQVFRQRSAANGPTVAGDLMVLICALALAGMTAAGKRYWPQSGGIGVNAIGYIGGAILFLPMLFYTAHRFDLGHISSAAWMGLFYMGAFSSVTGYLVYYYALERISASRIAAFQYLQPVFASAMAMGMLGEHLSTAALLAAAMIFAGVFVTERFG